MSDRLEELRRQRELQRAHLDWLDREIAALEGGASPEEAPVPRASEPDRLALDAEAILSQYRRDPDTVARGARNGCLIYVYAFLFLAACALGAMIWTYAIRVRPVPPH